MTKKSRLTKVNQPWEAVVGKRYREGLCGKVALKGLQRRSCSAGSNPGAWG